VCVCEGECVCVCLCVCMLYFRSCTRRSRANLNNVCINYTVMLMSRDPLRCYRENPNKWGPLYGICDSVKLYSVQCWFLQHSRIPWNSFSLVTSPFIRRQSLEIKRGNMAGFTLRNLTWPHL